MKLINVLSVLLLMTSQIMAQSFEGVITMNTTNEKMKEKATVAWYLKGDRSRMDISSSADGHNSDYAIILDSKGMAMVSEGHVTQIASATMKSDMATLALVSEKEGVTMNGFTCKQAVYSDGVNQTTYWLTEGVKISFDDIPAVLKRNMPQIPSKGFPVRMEKRNKEGKVVLSQDVVSIIPSKVDDSKFDRK